MLVLSATNMPLHDFEGAVLSSHVQILCQTYVMQDKLANPYTVSTRDPLRCNPASEKSLATMTRMLMICFFSLQCKQHTGTDASLHWFYHFITQDTMQPLQDSLINIPGIARSFCGSQSRCYWREYGGAGGVLVQLRFSSRISELLFHCLKSTNVSLSLRSSSMKKWFILWL